MNSGKEEPLFPTALLCKGLLKQQTLHTIEEKKKKVK
jgi:hypothetical protein